MKRHEVLIFLNLLMLKNILKRKGNAIYNVIPAFCFTSLANT